MTEGSGTSGRPRSLDDEDRAAGTDLMAGLEDVERRAALEWVGEHLPEVKRSAYGQRSLYWALGVALAVGLAVYTGGYAIRSSVTTEPMAFVGDLLYTLGWALWTGVVVVVYLQVIPEVKRRGYQQLLDAYEAERAKADAKAKTSANEGTTSRS
jgi:hypothetical protein